MKKVIVSVINDLTTDQRVDRTCRTLVNMGFDVLLVGRKLPESKPLIPRQYRMHRMCLMMKKGPLFYAEYNIRLFFFLLFHKKNLLVSNDLDTLLANYLVTKFRFSFRKKTKPVALVHDCHEYFREMPELVGRPRTQKFWKLIEDWIFPKLKQVYAVNESIAHLYHKEYGNTIEVIRNVPFRKSCISEKRIQGTLIHETQKMILYQGAVNVDRGLEEAIEAMRYLASNASLVIAGTGDVLVQLKYLVQQHGVSDRVFFTGEIPFQELHALTCQADVGLSIEKDVGLNYHYCLPNKFLDYIQAEVPVLVSPFPEMKRIIDMFDIGEMIESHDPRYLAEKLDRMLQDPERMNYFKTNLKRASAALCWENEESVFNAIFQRHV